MTPPAPPPAPPADGAGDDRMGRARIVEAARRLIDSGGVEALSMRKLAADLGVAPTAIYWHVGSRDDVLHAVLDTMIAELPPIRSRGATPAERLASVARALRAQVRTAPTAYVLGQVLQRAADVSFPGQVALAREVSDAGLHGDEAAHAVRAILYLVGGFQLLEVNLQRRTAGSRTTSELWRAAGELTGVDAALRDALARPVDLDDVFGYALGKLLASILGD